MMPYQMEGKRTKKMVFEKRKTKIDIPFGGIALG